MGVTTSTPETKIQIDEYIEKTENVSPNKTKKSIPKPLRKAVWDKYIGIEAGIGECYTCKSTIDKMDFECGHVIAESNGGTTNLQNLRPVCGMCNKSMRTKNLLEFGDDLGLVDLTTQDKQLLKQMKQLNIDSPPTKEKKISSTPICKAITKKGIQCQRKTKHESGYCHFHQV